MSFARRMKRANDHRDRFVEKSLRALKRMEPTRVMAALRHLETELAAGRIRPQDADRTRTLIARARAEVLA